MAHTGFVAVHTGAGNNVDEKKYECVIKDACFRAHCVLDLGGNAMDACEIAITCLENCMHTNAGYGSNLTLDRKVECEASIMNGTNMQFGACTNVSIVKNPIQLARRICDRQAYMLPLDRLPPMIMAGAGAEQYARELGCMLVNSSDMVSSSSMFTYEHYKTKIDNECQRDKSEKELLLNIDKINEQTALDTVGAVCLDSHGNLVAGCSSGGILLKLSGRVGQAATYGAGCWARKSDDISVATCTTGSGEFLMKTLLAKEICDDLRTTNCCATILHNTFKTKFLESPVLPRNQELYAGALTLTYFPALKHGELLWAHTTKSFCIGYMSEGQKAPKFVFSHLPTYCAPGTTSVVNGLGYNFANGNN